MPLSAVGELGADARLLHCAHHSMAAKRIQSQKSAYDMCKSSQFIFRSRNFDDSRRKGLELRYVAQTCLLAARVHQ